MTENEQLRTLEHLTGETETDILSTYLSLAKSIVLTKAYPYGNGEEELPAKYEGVMLEIAQYMLNKRGAEGETSHSENGIQRVYEDGDIPPTLLRRITPLAGVL